MRFGVALVASALLLTGVIVGAAPQLWAMLHAHEETPVQLPTFGGLATRSRILGVADSQLGVFELENSQPLTIDQVPDHVVAALNKAFYAAVEVPETRKALESSGNVVLPSRTPAELARIYLGDIERYRAIAKSINLQAQ